MRTDQLSNMAAQGGIITIGFLDQMRGETVINPFVKPQAFATFGSPAPENKKKLGENISESFDSLLERWDAISNSYEDMDISDARNKWIIPLLRELGFDPAFNHKDVMANGDEHLKFKLSHRGWVSPDAPMIHTVAPKQKLETRPTDGKGSKRSPHDKMQTFLNVSKDHKWGIVTNGISFRILRDFFHTTTKGYVEFDIENIMRERSYSDFRAFYRMAHASRFRGDSDNGDYPLEQFYKESVTAGEKVGQNLRGNVKRAIEVFGNGFLTLAPELTEQMIEDEELCNDYYSEILRVIYRILFLLYAEQRAMLPTRDSLYIDEYSITRLRAIAESRKGKDDHCDLWEGLKITFRMLAEGCPPLKVFPYNGSLFDKYEIPTIRKLAIKNHDLLEAIRCLTLFEEDRMPKRINYLDLDAEEIGSIYESLLDYTPRVLPSAMEIDGRTIPANKFFLDPRGSARKTTGSYYTDKRLVDELIKTALKPVAERKIAESEDKEAAILSLKVCDPACGSGAFLIAATNYLGKELAKVRTGQSEPPDEDIRRARRDVLQRCIYGVDQNPMVVELAKVSLWIDAAVNDLPLNFLNHHIKCGNSLIGATPELIEKGIPDEAFNPVEGDDRKVAKEIKSKNKKEKKQRTLGEFGLEKEPTWAYEYAKLSHAEEDDVDSVKWKQECYRAIVESPKRQHEKLVADTWCGAFFWQLNGDAPPPPTEATLRMMQKEMADGCVDPDTKSRILELADEHRFFHWHLEFPDVFEGGEGGFDCVLGNPPWKKIKITEREWFRGKVDKIANSGAKSKRMKLIEQLSETNPPLYVEWKNALIKSERTSSFINKSGKFPLSGVGDVNTYPLFTELDSLKILSPTGRMGMVVKTGIATDYYTQYLFSHFVENDLLVSIHDFVNNEGIFPDVAPPERFCLLTISGKENTVGDYEFSFYNTNFEMMADESRRYKLTKDQILRINPNTKNCPAFKAKMDRDITVKIYDRYPILIDEGTGENTWGISYHTMYHMANNSGLFVDNTLENLIEQGFTLGKDGIFRKGDEQYLPLWEAKYFHHFDHRFGTFEGVPAKSRFIRKAATIRISSEQKKNTYYEIIPRYWVRESDFRKRIDEIGWNKDWIFTFRDVTNTTTNFRSSICTTSPLHPCGHKSPILTFKGSNLEEKTLIFTGIFTSFIFDFILRQFLGGTSFAYYILKQLPMPTPEQVKDFQIIVDGKGEPLKDFLIRYGLRLIWTSHSLDSLGYAIAPDEGPFVWEDDERRKMRAELDAAIAKVYGLTEEEYSYILDTFTILRDRDITDFGEYKTKRETLEAFNRIRIEVKK